MSPVTHPHFLVHVWPSGQEEARSPDDDLRAITTNAVKTETTKNIAIPVICFLFIFIYYTKQNYNGRITTNAITEESTTNSAMISFLNFTQNKIKVV